MLRAAEAGRKLHRSAESSLNARLKKKIFEKTSWLNRDQKVHKKIGKRKSKTGPATKIKSVIFVPRTPSSRLYKQLRAEELRLAEITGYRVKVQERVGTQLRRILVKKNPLPEIPCGHESCMMCKNGKGGQCRRRNISYKTTCDNCKANNLQAGVENTPETVAHYIGESFRSGAERSANHISDYLNQKEESHIWKHKTIAHPDEEVTFSMQIIKKHFSSFERQVTECIYIEVHQRENILNSKSGFNRCLIPRLSVMMGEKEHTEQRKDKGKREKLNIKRHFSNSSEPEAVSRSDNDGKVAESTESRVEMQE